MIRNESPPVLQGNQMDTNTPLHRLARRRIEKGRDLKIIITAKNSQTGVGKTTLAGWLALSWTKQFAGHDWYVDPENPKEGMGTLNPIQYFQLIAKVGDVWNPGTVIVVDDAEELDARRSMQNLNVKFSQRWMLMRLKQAITIITLPSPRAIDSRLEELADVWINVERRGKGMVHGLGVASYGNRNVLTEKKHKMTFPNIAQHPELENLRSMKEAKMDSWDDAESEDDTPDPEEVRDETLEEVAQNMRDAGMSGPEIAEQIPYSRGWVYEHTTNPNEGAAD